MNSSPDQSHTCKAPPAAPELSAPTSIEIYPSGDLWISTGVKRFRVSSTALRLASPVFARMLDPTSPFSEGRSLANGTLSNLNLCEDDPDATEIILNVIHHRGMQVPQLVQSSLLFSIGELCDKYDMVGTLQGWANLWMSKIPAEDSAPWSHPTSSSTPPAPHTSVVRWLALSWAFRHPDTFEAITRHLIPNSKFTADGTLVDHTGAPLAIDGVPEKIADLISASIDTLHNLIYTTVYAQLSLYLGTKNLCRHKSLPCDRIQLGTLMRFMANAGLSKDPSVASLHDGPELTANQILDVFAGKENLATQLSQQQIVHYGAAFRHQAPTLQHVACTPLPQIHEALTKVINNVQGIKLSQVVPGH
ncbi:hypothetical protein DFH27DRAFT_545443 [Peziza echinospora]|nr:hypothetical protein DFH27DRAFT_545443 [Peziza echinospora]